jgi:hypothetical protein
VPALSLTGHWLTAKSARDNGRAFRSKGRQRVHAFVKHCSSGIALWPKAIRRTRPATLPVSAAVLESVQ